MNKKNKILVYLTILIFQNVLSQSEVYVKVGGNYQFIANNNLLLNKEDELESVYDKLKIFSKGINNKFNEIEITNEVIQEGLIVKVNYIEGGDVYFSYWKFPENDSRNEIYGPLKKVYSLSVDKFSQLTRERYNKFIGWRIKPFTVPVRLRGIGKDNFEFETNLSIGSSVASGIRYNLTERNRYFEFTGGIGITKVNLKPSNSNLENETLSPAAFTIAFGGIFHYDNVNAGLFLGWDTISGEEQQKYDWIHNKTLWLGLGLNIGISDTSKNLRHKKGIQNRN